MGTEDKEEVEGEFISGIWCKRNYLTVNKSKTVYVNINNIFPVSNISILSDKKDISSSESFKYLDHKLFLEHEIDYRY